MTRILRTECCMYSKELVYVEMVWGLIHMNDCSVFKHGSDKHFVKSVFSSAKEEDLKFFDFFLSETVRVDKV